MTGPFLDAALIRSARLDAHLTERGLARLIGVDALRVRRWEAGLGHATITLAALHALSAAIGAAPAELLRTGTEPAAPLPTAPVPHRTLSIAEARVLHTALAGELRLVARGASGIATRSLINDRTLVLHGDDPTRASTITVSTDIADTIHPPLAELGAERPYRTRFEQISQPELELDEEVVSNALTSASVSTGANQTSLDGGRAAGDPTP